MARQRSAGKRLLLHNGPRVSLPAVFDLARSENQTSRSHLWTTRSFRSSRSSNVLISIMFPSRPRPHKLKPLTIWVQACDDHRALSIPLPRESDGSTTNQSRARCWHRIYRGQWVLEFLKKLWEAASHRSWIATGGTIGVFRSPTEVFANIYLPDSSRCLLALSPAWPGAFQMSRSEATTARCRAPAVGCRAATMSLIVVDQRSVRDMIRCNTVSTYSTGGFSLLDLRLCIAGRIEDAQACSGNIVQQLRMWGH